MKCIVKNVRFIPMNVRTKWICPSRSLYIRPVMVGYQKYIAANSAITEPPNST